MLDGGVITLRCNQATGIDSTQLFMRINALLNDAFVDCVKLPLLLCGLVISASAAEMNRSDPVEMPATIVLQTAAQGFEKGARQLGLSAGGGFAVDVFGGGDEHDVALAAVDYGYMLTDILSPGTWRSGALELRGEVFAGAQFQPNLAYITGLAPILRYNFVRPSKFVPFLEFGAGLAATDMDRPDLSTVFNFNLQGGGGVQYWFRPRTAVTLQYKFLHISNARIDTPDRGVNLNTFLLGVAWRF